MTLFCIIVDIKEMKMKTWQLAGVIGFSLITSSVYANEPNSSAKMAEANITEIPTEEHAFIDTIGKLDKAKIVALLGEPAKADDVRLKDSGRVVASIWHYHFINTNAEGTYYETTELDFIDDKVNVVVFLNNDGTDVENGQKYEVPDVIPTM
jgi:hypothetical protein